MCKARRLAPSQRRALRLSPRAALKRQLQVPVSLGDGERYLLGWTLSCRPDGNCCLVGLRQCLLRTRLTLRCFNSCAILSGPDTLTSASGKHFVMQVLRHR